MLVFDEAHILAECKTVGDELRWSNLGLLQRALRTMNAWSLFSFFLSTTGGIAQFVSSKDENKSKIVSIGDVNLIPPFTDLGFDNLVMPMPVDMNIRYITQEKFMARFGRPLFVFFSSQ